MHLYNVVVVGATGMVGRKFLRILEERKFPVERLIPVASPRSHGMELMFKNHPVRVVPLDESVFVHAEIAFFSAGAEIARHWAPIAARHCAIVIDNSSAWRMERDVPLVVPEVNPRALFKGHSRIIANPNCSTIQMLVALKPLHDAYRARRIVVATYQAVSGAGHHGAMQLHHELHGAQVDRPAFPHAIAGNAIPHIAMFYSDGYTKEEVKMIDETHKILGDPTVRVAPTCVRIPVANCHSEAVNIEFERPFEIRTVRKLLEHAPGVVVVDDPADNRYPLAIHADGRDEVFVGRIRRDESVPNGLALWIVADNLRKGAATNAVQIAETWLEGPAAYHVATG